MISDNVFVVNSVSVIVLYKRFYFMLKKIKQTYKELQSFMWLTLSSRVDSLKKTCFRFCLLLWFEI